MPERYEIFEYDGSYWFRCKECGEGAGYKKEEMCREMAERHVALPHY
jgi:hypothetical protein